MTRADISQVAAIEREAFPTTWPQTAYHRELENRLARYIVVIDQAKTAPMAVQETSRRSFFDWFRRREEQAPTTDYIVGYLGLWLLISEAHITAVAVQESYRRRGLGELLLIEAIEMARENRIDAVSLEVRRSNVTAQALYEKYRFDKVGVRPRYYSDNHEDAIIMTTPLINSVPFRERFAYLKEQHARKFGAEG